MSQHTNELTHFLKSQNIDIMLVSETHFTNHSFFKIPQYSFHHVTHPDGTAHGGSGVIIKSKIKHHLESTYRTNEIQATNIVADDWY